MSVTEKTRVRNLSLQIGFGLALLTGYTIVAAVYIERLAVPHLVIEAFIVQVTEQALIDATLHALYAIFLGFGAAVLFGVPLGLAMGLNQFAEEFLDPYVNGLYVLPVAAVVPAFILWFGSGLRIRFVVVFIFAVFPVIINTFEGAKSASAELIEVAKSFEASRRFVLLHVIAPYEMPYIKAGMRIGINRAVKGLVVCEIIVAVTGLGGLIRSWSAAYRMEGVLSIVLLLMLIGIVLPIVVERVFDRLIWWDTPPV